MMRLVMGLGGAGLAALATVLAVAWAGTPDTTATRSTAPPPAAEIRGPCDETEHAGDPRCTGAAIAPRQNDDQVAEDVGDDDPAGENERSDDRGRHSGHGDDSGNDDDRSGSNSGRG